MQIEREKRYLIENFDKSLLECLGEPLHIEQYYLKMCDYVKSAINYYHGANARMGIVEARVRVVSSKMGNMCYFTVKSDGNLARKESEVLIPEGVAENLIENFAETMVVKDRYMHRTGLHIVEINNFLDRDLILAEIEYDGDMFTEEDIDEEMSQVISSLDPNAIVGDKTRDDNYKNKNLALPYVPKEVEYDYYDDENEDEEESE
jgi:CYTH domain-containing protein